MAGTPAPTMGHRALVAYGQSDGTYTLRYAHWGDGLATDIGPETPLGGRTDRTGGTPLADELGVDRVPGYDPPGATRVDPRPLAVAASAEAVVAAVDPGTELLVVVSERYEATPYLVCWLDPTGVGSDPVFADPVGDPDALRSWFVERKSRLSKAVAAGDMSRESARATLRRALAARATLYPPDDAYFLRDR